jgi:MFS family permease
MLARADASTQRSLGRQFNWLWGAFAVSTFGTFLAFDALPLIAIRVLHVGPAEVSLLASAGLAVGALVAVPLGPWVEFRRKRAVMIGMDLTRFLAMLTVPVAYALGRLTFGQLLLVAVVVAAADIAFRAASGAFLKALVDPADLLVANGRFESTQWTAIALGPPIGGAAIGLFGPVTTVVANAVSFVLSAAGIRAIGSEERQPKRPESSHLHPGDLLAGWRFILQSPLLRPLFFNTILVNGLIMATAPLMAVLMLGRLGFAPWQYGLAFGLPCVGGLVGARLSRPLAGRFGQQRTMFAAGTLRACWSFGLVFVRPGPAGLLLVMAVQFALVTTIGVFNPLYATFRLAQTPTDRVARVLSAWSISSNATTAVLIAIWGLLAAVSSPRAAIASAGLLMLGTPALLPRRDRRPKLVGAVPRQAYPRDVAKLFEGIDAGLQEWLEAQPVFFVATAPLAGDGHVNLSPKGMAGTFRVLDEHTVGYLDLTGSGIETIAHLRENGRITLMFCAFDGRPRIVRLQGTGHPVLLGDPEFDRLADGFTHHDGERAVIRVEVTRVSDSCGYAVPKMDLVEEREVLDQWARKKGPDGTAKYRLEKNATSIDGLPGWPAEEPAAR